jgi:glycosyltransferase involved in cell wall biosynthesis
MFAEIDQFGYKPLISVIVPTYNTPEDFLREMIESVQHQTYENWELVLVDDASTDAKVREIIAQYAQSDARIVAEFLTKNHHIAQATNRGIEVAQGEFIALFDHDDLLWDVALYEVVKALNANSELNFIYSDEDKIYNTRDTHIDHFAKPNWNPEFLRSCNYITHLSVFRKSVLDAVGYENEAYNGAQDWELILRVTRNIPPQTIYHINQPIYSWRVHSGSTAKEQGVKPYVTQAQQHALEADLVERNLAGEVVARPGSAGIWEVHYALNAEEQPLVIAICSDVRFVKKLFKKLQWVNYSVCSSAAEVVQMLATGEIPDSAYILHIGAVRGKVVAPTSENWLQLMLGFAVREDIGAVQPLILQKHRISKTIVAAGADFLTNLNWRTPRSLSQMLYLCATRNISAVNPAFYLVRANLFNSEHMYSSDSIYISSVTVILK